MTFNIRDEHCDMFTVLGIGGFMVYMVPALIMVVLIASVLIVALYVINEMRQ